MSLRQRQEVQKVPRRLSKGGTGPLVRAGGEVKLRVKARSISKVARSQIEYNRVEQLR